MTAITQQTVTNARVQINTAGTRELAEWLSMALVTNDTTEELEDWLIRFNDGALATQIAKIVRGWIAHN